MAVPDTSTFDLQTVVNVVNPTTDDLIDSFADAVASKFDSTYSGSKNQLLNFRNYDATVVNTLTVEATSTLAIPSYPLAYVDNQSTNTQNLTFTWQYVSQSGDLPATVRYNDIVRSVGYTTPAITESFGSGAKYPPFSVIGGNATTLVFKFTLTNASVDNVPSSPDNVAEMDYRHNF
jgi:hypothetical protein